MERFFNNAGPSVAEDHYMIDPLQRINVTYIERLIRQKRYFVLHAPRQTGKTSCLMALMHHLNALGYELTDLRVPDRSVPITLEDYRAAREKLIQSRVTHLDQLQEKLKEQRVHRVMAAVLAGEAYADELSADDVQYVADLGLITTFPEIRIANRIYQGNIPRELIWTRQIGITHQQHWYLTAQRWLDMHKLLAAFQQYFREHAEAWIERFSYKEAGPQLLLQAFLQRIVNGGGRITREYGLGRRRTDLFIEWPLDEQAGFHGKVQRIVLELKIQRGSLDTILQQGLTQTIDYADKCAADEQHLLIFDRRPDTNCQEKNWYQTKHIAGREIDVWGL